MKWYRTKKDKRNIKFAGTFDIPRDALLTTKGQNSGKHFVQGSGLVIKSDKISILG